jgi:large subunit ribosomal protein L29
MKASEMKEMTNDEVVESIQEQEELLTKMRLQHAVSPLENPNTLGAVRKTIARLKTEKRSRELQASK